ncbi:MAG: hypothetical protein ABIJ96_04075 [Elusimicrobiota bacterium]
MICPNCGDEGGAATDQCPYCGIFYIKWMIRQHRTRKTGGNNRRRPPRRTWGRAWTLALVIGFAAGAAAARYILSGAAPRPNPYARLGAAPSLLRERTKDILRDALIQAKPLDVRLEPVDFTGYFLQGVNSLNLENLKASDARVRPLRPGTAQESKAEDTLPCKCLVAGQWKYFASPPGKAAGAQECWSSIRKLKRDTIWDNPFWEISWEKLVWAPAKKRWAHFTPEEDRAFFARFIAEELDANAEKLDAEQSLREFRAAGKNPALLKIALVTAYRTRLRRAGARYRLEKMEK